MSRPHRRYKDENTGMTFEIIELEDGSVASAATTELGFTIKKKSSKTQDELQEDLDIYAFAENLTDITDQEPVVYENKDYIGEITF